MKFFLGWIAENQMCAIGLGIFLLMIIEVLVSVA
jgi:hypothetical protein